MFRKCVTPFLIVRKHFESNSRSYKFTLFSTPFLVPSNPGTKFYDRPKSDEEKEEEERGGMKGVMKVFFGRTDYYTISPQLSLIYESITVSALCGACVGAFQESRATYMKFMRENQATKYINMDAARTDFTNKMMHSSVRGGFRVMWRFTLFTSMTLFTMVFVEAYRGKGSPLDMAAGGAVGGAIYKTMQGPKAMFSGSVFGGLFGTVAGVSLHGLLWLTGLTLEDLYELQNDDVVRDFASNRETDLKQRTKEENKFQLHESLVEEKLANDAKQKKE